MYRKYFGLLRSPFAKEIEPDELFRSCALQETTARLGHLIEMRGIGLTTGDSGSGKSTMSAASCPVYTLGSTVSCTLPSRPAT